MIRPAIYSHSHSKEINCNQGGYKSMILESLGQYFVKVCRSVILKQQGWGCGSVVGCSYAQGPGLAPQHCKKTPNKLTTIMKLTATYLKFLFRVYSI